MLLCASPCPSLGSHILGHHARHDAGYFREEPGAGKPPARICEGEAKWPSYSTTILIARTEARHTHVEWLRFLKQIDRETPRDLDLHLIADNYSTHKHPKVRAWLEKHPRITVHFTPTSSSWLNMVERFFADLTADVIRAGSFTSVNDPVRDIKTYLAQRNATPKPYLWKASGAEILAKDSGGYLRIRTLGMWGPRWGRWLAAPKNITKIDWSIDRAFNHPAIG